MTWSIVTRLHGFRSAALVLPLLELVGAVVLVGALAGAVGAAVAAIGVDAPALDVAVPDVADPDGEPPQAARRTAAAIAATTYRGVTRFDILLASLKVFRPRAVGGRKTSCRQW